METRLIRALDLRHMVSIPMRANDAVNEEVIFSSCTSHCFFEKDGVAHSFVHTGAELVEESIFHVTGEFLLGIMLALFGEVEENWLDEGGGCMYLLNHSLEIALVFLLVCMRNSRNLGITSLRHDLAHQ